MTSVVLKALGLSFKADLKAVNFGSIMVLAASFLSVGVFGKFMSVFYALLGIAGCFYIDKNKADEFMPGGEKAISKRSSMSRQWMYR